MSTELEDQKKHRGTILVVDDSRDNLLLLNYIFRQEGYRVVEALTANAALEKVQQEIPDIILLDVMLPDMSGIEVCRILRSNPQSSEIPIIFHTATIEEKDKTEFFHAGGNDFVTKPYNSTEIKIRVQTQLELSRLRKRGTETSAEIEEVKRVTNELLGVLSHDLRNPLATITLSAALLQKNIQKPDPRKFLNYVTLIDVNTQRMTELLTNILELYRLEAGRRKFDRTLFNLKEVVRDVISVLTQRAKEKQQTIATEFDNQVLNIETDRSAVLVIVQNLLSNAIKFSPYGKKITVRVTPLPANGIVRLEVLDEGPGISDEDNQLMYRKLGKLSAHPTGGETSSGLGLALVKMLAEAIQATVRCESNLGEGATFIVDFQTAPAADY